MKYEVKYIELNSNLNYLCLIIENKTFIFINEKKTTSVPADIVKMYRN